MDVYKAFQWSSGISFANMRSFFCILRLGGTGRVFGGARQVIPKLIDSRVALLSANLQS